jgi:Mg-chelatase subunit ChlD
MLQFDEPVILWAVCAATLVAAGASIRGLVRSARSLARAGSRRLRAGTILARRAPAAGVLVRMAALLVLGLVAAGPRWAGPGSREPVRRADVVFLLDVSASMWADDLAPNRFEAARNAVVSLLRTVPAARASLIVFGGGAAEVCPATTDHTALLMFLGRVDPGRFVSGGTGVRAGLLSALKSLERTAPERGGAGGLILLISDGEFHGASVDDILADARARGIQVDTLCIGTEAGTVLRVPAAGGSEVRMDAEGRAVRTRARPAELRRIAERAGGRAWRWPDAAPGPGSDLVGGLKWLDRTAARHGWSLSLWGLWTGLALLLGSFALTAWGRR